jgi:glycosyltransferase involved in cell wall biosynthesis
VAAKSLRKSGIPVVTGIDDIWWKTLRQKFASIIFPFFKNFFFSHAWVTGPYQYEFAKRLGFKNSEIIHNCYSADIEIFNAAYKKSVEKKKKHYPHRFLYAGRIEFVKGIDLLIQAWNEIKELRKDWTLCIIGSGSLYHKIASFPDVIVLDFMQPETLAKEIENSGCYILPSRFEAWALVLHEFSAAGLPIICSDICGAAPVFLIPGYNGFIFKAQDINDLKQKMLKIINSSDDHLILMSENSHKAGQRISPEITAASFMSVFKE